jgi:hypothetical protein
MGPATNVGMSFTRSNVTTFEDPTLPAGTVLRSTSTITESISGNEWFGDYYKKYGSFFSGADIRSMTWDRSRFWDLSVATESGIVTVGTGMTREEQRLLAEAEALSAPNFFLDPANWISMGYFLRWGYQTGLELSFGRNFRIAPFGNRTGNPYGELPHYHRRITGPDGETVPGGSMKWHRPWEQGW